MRILLHNKIAILLVALALCQSVVMLGQDYEKVDATVSFYPERFTSDQEFAAQNLISLSDKATYQSSIREYIDYGEVATAYAFANIKEKLDAQILKLDTLSKETDDLGLANQTKEYLKLLENNKDITENTIKKLK